jgi:uncharacterized LabA/DUF88 family protein
VSKNVAVFVDVANIFYAAKAAGADIDYVTLLKAAVAGRDFVRAYAYTGLDPENENQRNFHSFLARHGYKVVSKDIRKYGDGKVKANLDIELVVDMIKTARNLDVAVLVSGDGDFAPAIRAVQEMGVRVEVISFRGNTSSDLIDVADGFYDITQVARVDRDSSRSGRRVAGDEEDLSMTEVPEKQTEGRGGRRGRTRKAGRGGEETGGRAGGRLVALPGEKLSRAAEGEAGATDEEAGEAQEAQEGQAAEGGRRRRRRGGRGRGHGRGHDELAPVGEESGEEGEEEGVAATPASRPNQFGSVWDSQIGMVGRPEHLAPVGPPDEDDFAEPEIPEYLLAERKRGGRGRGGRGARGAYASAVERERFGRSSLRYPEPARQAQPQRRREERPQRQQQPQQRRGGGAQRGGRESAEPWSEVPPELEELLRAQLSSKLTHEADQEPEVVAEAPAEAAPKRRASARKKAEAAPEAGAIAAVAEAKPAPRGRRKKAEDMAEAAPKRRASARKKAEAAPEAGEIAEAAAQVPAEALGEAVGDAAVETPAELVGD